MIRALSFCKFYSSAKKSACKDINFEAQRGKTTVLLGPNGAGKSTLLKALCAQHYATSGQVLAERNDGAVFDAAQNPQEVKAITGFVSEVPALYDDWTVQEFLEACAALRETGTSCKTITAAAQKAARLCKLETVLNQKISSLSHGYKQRVNFAQALVHDPQILILDEPATGLDPEQIREMRELVQSQKKGRAIVFSTHIIQEAQALADAIYIIKDGSVAAFGSPAELLKKSGKSSLEDAYLFFVATGAASTDSSLASDSGATNDSATKTPGPETAGPSKTTAAAFFRLVKKELFAYAINPFYWIAAALFALFSSAAFFFGTRFFVQGLGSASLSPFFLAMPYILSVLIPAFCMNIKGRVFDQTLPFGEFAKVGARLCAAMVLFLLYLLGTLLVPICVSFFGSVDFGAAFTAYLGLLFFAMASTAFCLFLSCLFENRAAYFAFAVIALSAINFSHNILNYVQLSAGLSDAIRSISFAWRFDSASKGILDTRDLASFALWALVFLLLAVYVVERNKGKKFFFKRNAFRSWTVILVFVFLFLDAGRVYARLDFSAGKNYTPSERTKTLLSQAQERVRISYYRSAELLKLYPQVKDVGDFLRSLSYSCKNVSYTELDAGSAAAQKTLNELAVQPFQMQNQKGNSLEYINAYSVVVIDYMDKSLYLPAAFSTFGLEYDLNLRLDYLLRQKSRRAYLLCANGMSLQKDYKSAIDWLNLEGFETIALKPQDLRLTSLDKTIPLALFGTKDLDPEGAAAIFDFAGDGGALLVMASPYTVNVNGDWSLKKNKLDYMLPILERFGISFNDSLAADLSCVRANFYSADKNEGMGGQGSGENKSVNYPLWINLLPQEGAPYGANVFWASPLSLDKTKAQPLLTSSPASWRFLPDKKNPDLLFDTNPFTVPKTAIADPLVQKEESVLAARTLDKKIIAISGDLFANDLLLSLSGGETGDFRNFNYLTTSLLELSGESDMAALKNKGAADFSLWKISSAQEWQAAKNLSLLLNFAALPLALLILMAVCFARRKVAR
jgi:ABC-type multidrug transport system ATPase subunit/ABC-type uncharacterized transport system involved in gliding motility auxiliary subunit